MRVYERPKRIVLTQFVPTRIMYEIDNKIVQFELVLNFNIDHRIVTTGSTRTHTTE